MTSLEKLKWLEMALHNLDIFLNLTVAQGGFIKIISDKWTLLFPIPSLSCEPSACAVCVCEPWQKPAKLEKPELQLSRISEGKSLCYQLFLSVNNVSNTGLVSKTLLNHQGLLPRAGAIKSSLNVSVYI